MRRLSWGQGVGLCAGVIVIATVASSCAIPRGFVRYYHGWRGQILVVDKIGGRVDAIEAGDHGHLSCLRVGNLQFISMRSTDPYFNHIKSFLFEK